MQATAAVIGRDVQSIGEAWKVYDRRLEDSRVGMRQEPLELDAAFREATRPYSRQSSPKVLGDCYLLAVSESADATLVTLDQDWLPPAGRSINVARCWKFKRG